MKANRINYSNRSYNLNCFSSGKPVEIGIGRKIEKAGGSLPDSSTKAALQHSEEQPEPKGAAAGAGDIAGQKAVPARSATYSKASALKANRINYSGKHSIPDFFGNGKPIIAFAGKKKEKRNKPLPVLNAQSEEGIATGEPGPESGVSPIKALEGVYSRYLMNSFNI